MRKLIHLKILRICCLTPEINERATEVLKLVLEETFLVPISLLSLWKIGSVNLGDNQD